MLKIAQIVTKTVAIDVNERYISFALIRCCAI